MKEKIELYKKYYNRIYAFSYAFGIISWDSYTVAPKKCFENRSKQIGILSEEQYKLITSDEYINIVNELYNNKEELDELLKHEIIEVKRSIDRTLKVPMNEYIEYQVLLSKSQQIWTEAKQTNDFKMFYPTLEKIIEYTKKIYSYYETPQLKGYNLLLDDYERGMTEAQYDKFFNKLKEDLVPFVKKVTAKKQEIKQQFLEKFSTEKQKEFVYYLAKVMNYDLDRGVIAETEHPFTTGIDIDDVRVTVHYYEDLFISSIFSAIHEMGHATYEMQCDEKLNGTGCFGGASCALHESQSRFYENIIGRSYEFWSVHFKELKRIFSKELKGVTVKDFYNFVNNVENSYIRTEADELTYPLHIMLRYDIEKEIMNNTLQTKDIEKRWNELFYQYFGIKVENAKDGVLQDVHWAQGSFGYFPTYALGSAYASQFYACMKKDINIKKALESGTIVEINEWLKDKIHKYGASKYPLEILKLACNQNFNPNYYVKYLINKYSKIYGIK